MRTETKAAIVLTAGTNLRRVLLAGLAVVALTSCGGGGDGEGSCSAPQITSVPPTVASVGQEYQYQVDAPYFCLVFFIPGTCQAQVDGVQLPSGAKIGGTQHDVYWTPATNQANTNVQFQIATESFCGNRATQSWTVHVYAAPVIESFTAARAFIIPGESTMLTGVFQGSGRIEGIGPVTSGVPIATPVLNASTIFTLHVANSVGAEVGQALTITIQTMPTVTSTNPVNGAMEMPVNRALTATFNNKMDSATITAATFLLKDGSNIPVSGTVTYADEVATFAPANSLRYLTPYTATITDGVKDLAGNSMAANYVWSFTTGAPDTTPPAVSSTSPANGADRVEPANIRLLVTFSESIDPNSVNSSTFILKDSSENPVNGAVRLTIGGNSAEFLPATALANSMSYTAIVTTGIKDLAGNTMAADYSWTFITGAFGTWQATSTTGAPFGRGHTAVWTGSEMIVWGGYAGSSTINSGARYNPVTDSWAPTSTTGAPSARTSHTAVWTGSEMIVWGGNNFGSSNSGARYNPATDAWVPTSTIGAPSGKYEHTAVWTGSEMIVWGGRDFQGLQNTGARYNPVTDVWAPTSITGALSVRVNHTAVWTGSEMIVWGGSGNSTGARYNSVTDTWLPTSTTGAPSARYSHTAVWTGSEMIVWGGYDGSSTINSGARYNPVTHAWPATSNIGALSSRMDHTGIWTGSEMIVWGGNNSGNANTGGRYRP